MCNFLSLALAGALLLLSGAPAAAGDAHDPRAVVEHIFDVADADGSGTLSEAEYAEAGLERFGVSFADSDLDGNGETSLTEYLALYDRHHASGDEVRL